MKSLTTAIILVLTISTALSQNPKRKLLIMGIDGCRGDAIVAANTPNMDALIANGTYSWDALTEEPTWSGVGWTGMLTGVWRNKHLVTDNSFSGSNVANYPHFFNHLEAHDTALHTASFVHWDPINDNIVDQVDFSLNLATDTDVRTQAVSYLSVNDPDVLFLHFDDVDAALHSFGAAPSVPQYIAAIEAVDAEIGLVMAAVNNRPNIVDESWAIMVSTDHGGNMGGHGGASFEERNIFLIVSGDEVTNQQISLDSTDQNIGDALLYNGTDNYTAVASNPLFDFGPTQDFTLECRVKTTGYSSDPAIVSNKDWASGNNPGFVIAGNTGSNWKINIGDGSNRVDFTGSAIDDGLWHHLSVTCDRDGMMTVYEEGNKIGQVNMAVVGNINTGFGVVFAQDGTTTYPAFFAGNIAEIRIWNTVLPAQSITDWSCSTVSASHPEYANLIGYWQSDEGSGTTLVDATPNANNATLAGAAPTWEVLTDRIVCYDLDNTPRQVDLAYTALDYMCVPIDASWELDGRSWAPECPPDVPDETALAAHTATANALYIFHLHNGAVQLSFEAEAAHPSQLDIIDMQGRKTMSTKLNSAQSIIIQPGELANGTYLGVIRNKNGNRIARAQFAIR